MPPKYRPPMWSSKAYGEPHGMWEAEPEPEISGSGKPRVIITAARVLQMEDQLRAALDRHLEGQRNYVRQYLTKTDALTRVLEVGDKARPKNASTKKWKRSGKIERQVFLKVAERRLGLMFTKEEVATLFAKYGHDRNFCMPYRMFAARLFASKAKVLAMEGFQTGAYSKDRPAAWGFNGMIKYPFCKQAVCPPSEWNAATVSHSAEKPPTELKLEHVYGYSNSKNVAPNLYYTATGKVVYYTAAVGIVYEDDDNTQNFFLGHDDDICCLALHPIDRDTVATGQFGAVPKVLLWSAETTQGPSSMRDPAAPDDEPIPAQELTMPYGDRAVVALAFGGPDGRYLVSVSTDDAHSIRIWNWKKRQNIANAKGYNSTPPQPGVLGVVCNPFVGLEGASPFDFCTFGQKHIYFWSLDVTAKAATSKNCVFGKCKQQDIFTAAFLPNGQVLTGGQNGTITVWQDAKATYEKKPGEAHKSGSACTVLRLRQDRTTLLSGGADHRVIVWNLSPSEDGVMELAVDRDFELEKDGEPGGRIVGLDCSATDDTFIAGDAKNDIWKVDEDPDILVQGMSGDVCGVAPHPLLPHVYATACSDGTCYVWDARVRKCICELPLQRKRDERGGKDGRAGEPLSALSVAYSLQGDMLAVGTSGVVGMPDHPDRGGVVIVYRLNTEEIASGKYPDESGHTRYVSRKMMREEITDLKFSCDGRWLAAASRDTNVHIFDVDQRVKRVGLCKGHSSAVMHVDWSVDNRLMSSSMDMELLYWERDPERRGWRKCSSSQRDTAWHTYTSPLGFPVMGIWQDDMDGSDINALSRSEHQRLVATADDHGKVRLYNYPCVVDKAEHKAYSGHSSHVQNLRFINNDERLVSCGGRDRSLLQWRLDPPLDGAREPEPGAAMTEKFAAANAAARGEVHKPKPVRVGASANPQVELRVRELHTLVQMQKRELAAKQEEITRLLEMLGT